MRLNLETSEPFGEIDFDAERRGRAARRSIRFCAPLANRFAKAGPDPHPLPSPATPLRKQDKPS